MRFASLGLGGNIAINYAPAGFSNASVFAGIYNWTPQTTQVGTQQVPNPWPLDYPFSSFCIDLKQDFTSGQTYQFTLAPVADAPVDSQSGAYPNNNPGAMGTTAAADLGRLWATDEHGLTTNVQAAAFQVAIWAVVYNQAQLQTIPSEASFASSFSVLNTSNSFYLSAGSNSTLVSDANQYVGDALFSPDSTNMLAALTSPSYQDQLVIMPTPASFSGGLVLLLLCGMTVWARRNSGFCLNWSPCGSSLRAQDWGNAGRV